MTASLDACSATPSTNRKRKAHTKSRRGCSSCKMRRVKCDEKKPACQQCKGIYDHSTSSLNYAYFRVNTDFGVSCTYGGKATGLTFAGESSFDLNDSFLPSNDDADTVNNDLFTGLPKISEYQRLSQASAIIGHCNGLPSPPDSDIEDASQKQMLGMAALEVMHRFNARTVLSVGTTQVAKLYQKEVFHLACMVS
jgi:hypothetical protein